MATAVTPMEIYTRRSVYAYIEKGITLFYNRSLPKMFNYPITLPELKIKNLIAYLEPSYISKWKMGSFAFAR